ncbi:type IX secretion system outer membrane channel protein PorV [Flavobacterium sp. GA093]|uniref:Type IX secretion system outer membrane channel protein PorV n=1 Tax=Flavobacterium hydrocarbonoxydans TaxID=2683249 RepID=A0A6I4NN44_9FLAO|nr:type IX secretion system outer membrane channel protein PorV [Flavobacterium hydrocarbonoxydans]MWB95710.1 type IX secretion system outer membrane channel protein PorV [Flavobacterium hydrocarbonoxydans]
MKKISLLFIFLFTISLVKAQDRVITTGVPFLLVAADARAAGLADQGVATSADVFSQQWNPAKYAFSIDQQGLSVSYTPYLTSLVNDISLSQLTYYNKIDERSAFAGSIRYFSIGDIELRTDLDSQPNVVKPSEFAIDGSYSLQLSPVFSMAVGARFISSNLAITTEGQSLEAAKSFAFDVAGFYQSEEIAYQDFNGRWRAGFNFQNMGPKINYDLSGIDDGSGSNFLPANLRLGAGFDFILDDYNKVAVSAEITKLLVPTPQIPVPTATDINGDGDTTDPGETSDGVQEANNEYNSIGWVPGIFQSFGDAPDGFSEELKEITYSLAGEYTYQDSFSMRAGYYHQSPDKGAVRFFSLGAGFKYNVIKVDVSYLFSTSKVNNPLENTLRFSLTFNFGEKYEEY